METEGKDKVYGIVGTGIFHLLIILSLVFMYMKPGLIRTLPEDLEGVPVMFGNVPDAFGNSEPRGRGNTQPANEDNNIPPPNAEQVATKKPTEQVPPKTTNNVVTQTIEETVAIPAVDEKAEAEKKKLAAEEAERKRVQAEADRKAREENAKKQKIENQMSGLFGNGDASSGSRGESHGEGTQGVETGNASYGKTSGIGGWGSYDLGGRSVGSGGLIRPDYTANDYGTVKVDIIVDPKGNVVEASIGRGTDTPNATLRNEALKAAKKTKFTAVDKPGNQKGTITYKFNLN